MTTVRRYECNLCRDSIGQDQGEINSKQGRSGIGILFGNGSTLIRKRLYEVECHICVQCAGEASRIVKEMRPE
jgi:hypothetical protein